MDNLLINNYWEHQEEKMFLPEKFNCPTLISFSGGRTSGYLLYKILQQYKGVLPDDVHIVFANTGKEMPETLDFINDCAKNWNVKVRWLELDIHEERPIYRTKEVTYETASRNGEPFEALINRKKMLPNPVARLCTMELKIGVMNRFMRSHGYKHWANVIGLRYDEPKRVSKSVKQNESGKNKYESLVPLFDNKVMVKDVGDFWANNDFDLKLPNHNGKTLAGNCDLCYLKGTKTLIKIIKEKPELADWWIEQEKKLQTSAQKELGRDASTAKFRKDSSYVELVELAKLNAKQIEMFNDDGRSCFCHD